MEQIKVFVDTNIVLDYFYDRMRDGCAKTIVLVGQESMYVMCISILTAINVLYITKKYETRVSPDDIARLFRILPQDYEQYSYAQTIDIDDFEDAIAEGSTMVRIGTAIFGARNYSKTEK